MRPDDARPARPHHRFTDDGRRVREVLSYARRGSRLTPKQAEVWARHAPDWVVPDDAVDRPGFSWSEWFGRRAPLVVEIGSGVGEATVALAAARPDVDIVAFEVWRPGVADTLARLAAAGVENVRLCGVDAVWTVEHTVEPDGLAELWTFFPDPWHKTRHHKRRLVAPPFAQTVAARLCDGAAWRLATDWREYAEEMVRVLDAVPLLDGGVVDRWDERPLTRFERRGIAAGRPTTDLAYRKISLPSAPEVIRCGDSAPQRGGDADQPQRWARWLGSTQASSRPSTRLRRPKEIHEPRHIDSSTISVSE